MSYDTVARAQALHAAGRAEEAVELLQRGLAADPDDAWMLSALVRAQLDLDPKDALEPAVRLVRLEPDTSESHRLCAIVHAQLGHRDQAIACARRAVAEEPSDPYAHSILAMALGGGKKSSRNEALAAAERSIELAPDSVAGYFAAGRVEMQAGNWKRSAPWFERVLELDPHHDAAQINLAIVNEAAGRLAPALSEMDARLRLDPTDAHARSTLDEIVYTTLVHLLWIVLVLMYVVGTIRDIP